MTEDAPESIDGTIAPSITERSQEAGEAPQDAARDGQQNDAHDWIETVIRSLNERSPETRQALLKALLNGGPTARSIATNTHPVSGTSFPVR